VVPDLAFYEGWTLFCLSFQCLYFLVWGQTHLRRTSEPIDDDARDGVGEEEQIIRNL